LLALQTSDENKVAMQLNWQPGDKVIVPAPKTLEGLAERKADKSLEQIDWYLAKKSL
jgi:peroxiredoxin (alkyl hydroperoxide reductase subunit C)